MQWLQERSHSHMSVFYSGFRVGLGLYKTGYKKAVGIL